MKWEDRMIERKSGLKQVLEKLSKSGIGYNDVKQYGSVRTTDDIIKNLAGGDCTSGSCSSLAFAYAGNKGGFDVLDFRDGASCDFFATTGNIEEVVSNAGGVVVMDYSDIKAFKTLSASVVDGKEYYFATAEHAAIIRRSSSGFEYLELQNPIESENRFKPLNDYVLKDRFGAQKSYTVYGLKLQSSSCIIDIEKLQKDPGFRRMLGYINTPASEQKKSKWGSIK